MQQGILESSIEIIIASITSSTLKQYNSAIKSWWEYCSKLGLNVLNYDVLTILNFLTEIYNRGVSYGTLNSVRSALAFLLSPRLALEPQIKRFFKGVYNLRPSCPRYDYTWDPAVVLNYVQQWDNYTITLNNLAKKLAVLLALATAHRLQTLSLIDIRNIRTLPEDHTIEIKIPDRIKTSGKNACQPTLVLPVLKEKPQICVATILRVYLERSTDCRPKDCHSLFITSKKPFKAATSQTLSKWIKSVLSLSGIDTNHFTAYSTRHASTSAAFRKGVSLAVIRKTAGWSKTSKTFGTFYNKPLVERSSFIKTVFT